MWDRILDSIMPYCQYRRKLILFSPCNGKKQAPTSGIPLTGRLPAVFHAPLGLGDNSSYSLPAPRAPWTSWAGRSQLHSEAARTQLGSGTGKYAAGTQRPWQLRGAAMTQGQHLLCLRVLSVVGLPVPHGHGAPLHLGPWSTDRAPSHR